MIEWIDDFDLTPLKVGDKAPDFALPSSNGGSVRLSQFIGTNIVIFFYPMDESPVCSKEAEAFRDKNNEFKELNAVVIGISSQNIESHKSFAARHNLPFILLSDNENKVRKLYAVSTTLGVVPGRVTYVIDKQGIIKHVYSSQIHPTKHANEALQALKS